MVVEQVRWLGGGVGGEGGGGVLLLWNEKETTLHEKLLLLVVAGKQICSHTKVGSEIWDTGMGVCSVRQLNILLALNKSTQRWT